MNGRIEFSRNRRRFPKPLPADLPQDCPRTAALSAPSKAEGPDRGPRALCVTADTARRFLSSTVAARRFLRHHHHGQRPEKGAGDAEVATRDGDCRVEHGPERSHRPTPTSWPSGTPWPCSASPWEPAALHRAALARQASSTWRSSTRPCTTRYRRLSVSMSRTWRRPVATGHESVAAAAAAVSPSGALAAGLSRPTWRPWTPPSSPISMEGIPA